MSEKDTELEALAEVYRNACPEGAAKSAPLSFTGLRAVIDAVRASDAARAGTMSPGDMADALRGAYLGYHDAIDALAHHAAAQGRANAALQKQAQGLTAQRQRLSEECTRLESERDALQQRAEQAERERGQSVHSLHEVIDALGEFGRQGDSAAVTVRLLVSAFATLRQAVENVADDLDGARAYHTPEFQSRECVGRAADALRSALDATPAPAEHHDTATQDSPTRKAWKEGEAYGWRQAIACASGEDYARPAKASMPAGVLEKAEALAADTATLRKVREWAERYAKEMDRSAAESDEVFTPSGGRPTRRGSDALSMECRARADTARCILALLGGSGPSGEATCEHHDARDEMRAVTAEEEAARCVECKGGGGEERDERGCHPSCPGHLNSGHMHTEPESDAPAEAVDCAACIGPGELCSRHEEVDDDDSAKADDWTEVEGVVAVFGLKDAIAAFARLKKEHEDGARLRVDARQGRKVAAIANRFGWNGVTNSKVLSDFVRGRFRSLRKLRKAHRLLKAEHAKAAEDMRERCAEVARTMEGHPGDDVAAAIRALPLTK